MTQPQTEGIPIPREVNAHCLKCSTSRAMVNPVAVTLKNGRPAAKGTCPECNTTMFRIGKH